MRLPAQIVAALTAAAAFGQNRPAAAPQRPSFSNDVTTVPGTLQFEFGTEASSGIFTLPTTLRLTPPTEKGLLHGMEFSLEWDSVEKVVESGRTRWKSSESLDLIVRRPLWKNEHWAFALAPRAEIFLRGSDGARLGGRAIAVCGFGQNSLVANLDGTAATDPSNSNAGWRLT